MILMAVLRQIIHIGEVLGGSRGHAKKRQLFFNFSFLMSDGVFLDFELHPSVDGVDQFR